MTEDLIPKLLLLLFTGASLGTSAVAGSKVVSQFRSQPVEARVTADIENITPASPTPPPDPQTPLSNPAWTDEEKLISSQPDSSPAPETAVPGACIITLFGGRYDVAPLRSTHSGGDIFTCGTDMTEIYRSQHGTDLSRMAPYAVSSSSASSPSAVVTPMPAASAVFRPVSDDEHESEDHDLEEARRVESHETEDD